MRVWWYMAGEDRKGPISQSQLEELFESGDVSDTTMVWCEGLTDWQQVSSIDEAALPVLNVTPEPSPANIQEVAPEQSIQEQDVTVQSAVQLDDDVSVSAPIVQFQGLTGTIDIIEVESPVAEVKKPVVEKVASVATAVPIVLQPSAILQTVHEEEKSVKSVAPAVEAPKLQESEVTPIETAQEITVKTVVSKPAAITKLEDMPNASFLEVASRGIVKRKKAAASSAKPPHEEGKKRLPSDSQPSQTGVKDYFSARYIAAGLAGFLAIFWLAVLLWGWGGSAKDLNSWTNPKTFNQIALDPQWSVTTSVNAEQQIFYRFTHKDKPLIVRFGQETFPDKTTLKDYGELFSMAIENELSFESKGAEEVILGSDTLTFSGHLVKEANQKSSVTFLKSGDQIWRILVINTSGGRAKTKSYQILRGKLIDSIQ